mgnify:CR=1 FL=1
MQVRDKSERRATAMFNQEGVRMERLKVLKNSLSAYRGHLTRSYRELKESMNNISSHEETIQRRDALESTFDSYKNASLKYYESLILDDEKYAAKIN